MVMATAGGRDRSRTRRMLGNRHAIAVRTLHRREEPLGFIEQGGRSLYPSLAQKVTNLEVLRVLLSIGPSETMHFQVWHDKAANAPNITDGNLSFPNLNNGLDPNTGANPVGTGAAVPPPTCSKPT